MYLWIFKYTLCTTQFYCFCWAISSKLRHSLEEEGASWDSGTKQGTRQRTLKCFHKACPQGCRRSKKIDGERNIQTVQLPGVDFPTSQSLAESSIVRVCESPMLNEPSGDTIFEPSVLLNKSLLCSWKQSQWTYGLTTLDIIFVVVCCLFPDWDEYLLTSPYKS